MSSSAGVKLLAGSARCSDPEACTRFAMAAANLWADEIDFDPRPALLACFAVDELRHLDLVGLAFDLVCVLPRLDELVEAVESGLPTLDAALDEPWTWALLADELMLGLLGRVVVPSLQMEALLQALRSCLLARSAAGRLPERAELDPLLVAMAHQAWLTDYLAPLSASDQDALDRILADESPVDRVRASLIACCRSLGELPDLVPRLPVEGGAAWRRLLRQQVEEPVIEAACLLEIPSTGPIADPGSQAVRAQYEEHPYPRGVGVHPTRPHSLAEEIELVLAGSTALELPRHVTAPRCLAAGCGTGQQVARLASRLSNAEVLGVDLSRASLASTMRTIRKAGLGNVRLLHADLLELEGLEDSFDLIECVGVLHHLDDPREGLRRLARRLVPGGWMRLGLYSELGRRDVVAARAILAEHGIKNADLAGLRAAHALIAGLPDDHPARAVDACIDFYVTPMLRDLLFPACEHRFTMDQLGALLEETGLEFAGFEGGERLAAQYSECFPGEPAPDGLAAWQRFEEANPSAFSASYHLWAWRRPEA